MRIVYLGKRHNMDIDSIGERHGRGYHLPWELSRLGHTVSGLYMDYRTKDGGWRRRDDHFDISVCSLRGKYLPSLLPYYRELRRLTRQSRPDVIIAGADALNIVIGRRVASRLRVPFVADVKDDYTAFGLTQKVPLLEQAYYRALVRADLVTCVSSDLEAKVRSKGVGHYMVLENAVPTDFAPQVTREKARKELGLPPDEFLFGVAGALRSSRDIATVLEGARRFLLNHEKAALVLAGPRDEDFSIPKDVSDRVRDLGQLAPHRVPLLFRALDLGVIPNSPGVFGDHCYPQKYQEMLACKLSFAVARVGVFASAASGTHGVAFVYESGDPEQFFLGLKNIYGSQGSHRFSSARVQSWAEQASKLEENILNII